MSETTNGGVEENAFGQLLEFGGNVLGKYFDYRGVRAQSQGAAAVVADRDRLYSRGRGEVHENRDFFKWIIGAIAIGAIAGILANRA